MRTIKLVKNDFLLLSRNVFSGGGLISCTVRGSSMVPFIRDGDIAMIEPVQVQTLSVGDVILFEIDNRLYLHRIIRKIKSPQECCFVARGDSVAGKGNRVAANQIIGQVKRIQRNGIEFFVSGFRQKAFMLLWLSMLPLRKLQPKISRICRALTGRFKKLAGKAIAT